MVNSIQSSTQTLCPYCGVGCGLEVLYSTQGAEGSADGIAVERISVDGIKVRGDRAHPSSQGQICVKGGTVAEALDRDRLLYPMYRERWDAPLERIDWERAYSLITTRIQQVLQEQGADGICMYGSGQLQTEDYYVAQKLLKGCLGTNNFDTNSRLCMSSAVAGYTQSFGSDGPPCCYEDLEQTDCLFVVGSNAAETHPIAFNRFRRYHKANPGVKLIVVDPRETDTCKGADLHLPIRPGSDIDLMNGMAYLLHRWGQIDQSFIEQHTSGYADFEAVIQHYPPEVTAQRCGISVESLEQVTHWWMESERVLSLWAMGVNQSSEGTAKVRAIINLHLLTGQIGKPGAGPFSLTGQPNAMGGRESGGLSTILPGYRSIKNPEHRADMERLWGVPAGRIAPYPGRDAWGIIEGLEQDAVGMLWIAATNPAVSLPDLARVKAALGRSPFTVYQDAYYPTETSEYAHLLLPAAQWGEKTGTMTNTERVVTLCQAFRSPPGEAKADWEIFAEVGRRLGFGSLLRFTTPAEVYADFARLTQGRPCEHSGLSHELLAQGPQQWPFPLGQGGQDDQGSSPKSVINKRLYTDYRFHTPDGRARFSAYHSKGLAEPPDEAYPFVLTTGRLYGHWHTQTRTGRIPKIVKMHPQPFVEIHPRDAASLGVEAGDWLELRSRRGVARVPAVITRRITPGVVFMPMHWGALWAVDAEVNHLMHPEACPDSLEPELKACAVQLQRIAKAN